jgi:O-antigen ligase
MVKSSAKAFVPLVLTISVGIWPCLSLFNKNNVGKQLFIALTLIILFFVDCDTSLVSIIGGGIAYLCYFYLPKLTVKMVKVCGITLMLSLPWLFSNFLTAERIQEINQHIHSVSYIHRLYVWQFVSHKIDGHWVKGYGGDSSRAECVGGELQNWTMVNKQGESINIHSKSIPLHPHNVALQLWLELGVIGAALGAVIYYLLLNQLSFLRVAQGAPLMGFFIAANVIFWINLGCWQSWWLATLGLLWPLSRSHAKLIE